MSLNDILHEYSADQGFHLAQYLQQCFRENIEVAAHAVVDLLKKKLDEIKDGQWVVVRGFPENTEQLLWFERLVSDVSHKLINTYHSRSKNRITSCFSTAKAKLHPRDNLGQLLATSTFGRLAI